MFHMTETERKMRGKKYIYMFVELNRLDCVWRISHIGAHRLRWKCWFALYQCLIQSAVSHLSLWSPDSQTSPFSPVPIIIMIIMIIIIISAQLDAWLPEWESSLCVRSEQFASSLRKPVGQKKLRYRVCQHCVSLATYCLSYPMKRAACGQFGEITLQHLKFCPSSQSQSRGKGLSLL